MMAHARSTRARVSAAVILAAAASALSVMSASTACSPAAFPKAPAAGSTMPDTIVDPYLKIQDALASDSVDDVRANAGNIATAATALGAPAMKIDTSALQLASASDLADARVKFGALSEAIDAYMTGMKLAPPDGVRVAFCPMVLKPWMQRDGTLRNPYYGSQMLTCGSYRN
jgi:hypothetical protein